MRGDYAIVALGLSPQGRNLGVSDIELRRVAIERALAEVGLERDAIDGYILAWHTAENLRYLGLSPRFSWSLQCGGASAVSSIIAATGAIAMGQAEMVACVYGLAPSAGNAFKGSGNAGFGDIGYGYPFRHGLIGAASTHAFHARWHMDTYGTTSRHLGAVAVELRRYASVRPDAMGFGQPITIEDHQASPMIVDPLRRLDCCRDTDGGVALLVTTAERAKALTDRPVYIMGAGTGHNIRNWHNGTVYAHHDDIEPAAARAFAQAGIELDDVDVASFYDPFTISVLMQLEAYGFCKPGQGGPFVADGGIGPDGRIPTNTGGGQLSGFYCTGFTAIVEAVRQLRGDGGATQVDDAGVALVSGHGINAGIQNTWAHATLLLGNQP